MSAVDSQGTSQNSLQRGKRKGRADAAVRNKRSSRPPDDMLMSQMGCSQQVSGFVACSTAALFDALLHALFDALLHALFGALLHALLHAQQLHA